MDKQQLPKITEEEIILIKRAQSGDTAAFNRIFHKYKTFVDNILYGYIGDWDEARDMTNFVFTKVYEKLSKFTTYDSFGGWLRILTNRVAVDYLRRTKNKKYTLGDESERLSQDSSSEQSENDLVNRLTMQEIFKILDTFPEKVKKVFELFYIDNMTVEMISKALNMPTGTIKSHLSRTRERLQTKLKLN